MICKTKSKSLNVIKFCFSFRLLCSDDCVQTIISAIKNNVRESTQLIIVITSKRNWKIWNYVKKICCVEIGIESHVIVSKTVADFDTVLDVMCRLALQLYYVVKCSSWNFEKNVNRIKF